MNVLASGAEFASIAKIFLTLKKLDRGLIVYKLNQLNILVQVFFQYVRIYGKGDRCG